jgi:hypothetical protein
MLQDGIADPEAARAARHDRGEAGSGTVGPEKIGTAAITPRGSPTTAMGEFCRERPAWRQAALRG